MKKLALIAAAGLIVWSAFSQATLHVGFTNTVTLTTETTGPVSPTNHLYANGVILWQPGQTNNGAALTNLTAEALAPGTIASNNASTFGQGGGLIRWDTNYVYVSRGTNSWGRVAVTNW